MLRTALSVSSSASEEWTDVNSRLKAATPREVLEWAVERFRPRLTMATAFGAEGCVLIHLLAEIDPTVRVFNLDTGYQFAETLALKEQLRQRYGIEVELIRPETTTAEYEAAHGGPVYVSHPDQCCYDRKIVPLRRAWWVTTPGSRRFVAINQRTGRRQAWWGWTRNSGW